LFDRQQQSRNRKKQKKDSEDVPIPPPMSDDDLIDLDDPLSPGSDDPLDGPIGGRGGRRDRGSNVFARSTKMIAPVSTSPKIIEKLSHFLEDLSIRNHPSLSLLDSLLSLLDRRWERKD